MSVFEYKTEDNAKKNTKMSILPKEKHYVLWPLAEDASAPSATPSLSLSLLPGMSWLLSA
jgi:hypothetical protein